jgi:hypothetical protein
MLPPTAVQMVPSAALEESAEAADQAVRELAEHQRAAALRDQEELELADKIAEERSRR